MIAIYYCHIVDPSPPVTHVQSSTTGLRTLVVANGDDPLSLSVLLRWCLPRPSYLLEVGSVIQSGRTEETEENESSSFWYECFAD